MADDTHTDSKIVAIAKSPFWGTWIGRLVAVFALWWVLPMDKVLKQGLKPVAGALESALALAWTEGTHHVATAANWFKRYAFRVLGAGLIIGFICLNLVLFGIATVNPYLVATGAYLWSAYLLVTWFITRSMLAPLTELAEAGVNLANTVFGTILKKIGFAEMKDEHTLTLNLKGIRTFLDQSFVMIVVSLVAGSLLTFTTYISETAPWRSCGAFVIAALALCVTLSVANRANVDREKGWKILFNWSFRVFLVCLVFGLAIALVPALREQLLAFRTGLNAWVKNPHFAPGAAILMLLPIVAILVFAALAAWNGTVPNKRALFAKLAGASIIVAVGLPIVLISNGSINSTDVATVSARIQASAKAAVKPSSALQPTSDTVASKTTTSSDGMEDIAEPGAPSAPQKRATVATESASETKMDFKGMSARQILKEFEE